MSLRALIATACAIVAAAGCGEEEDPPPAPGQPDVTEPAEPPPEGAGGPRVAPLDFDTVETVAEGLEIPWGLAFIDPSTILVTERPGRVRLVSDGELRPGPVAEIDVTHEGEGGLLGIALHPDFPTPRVAFLHYTTGDEGRISRWRVTAEADFENEEVLVRVPAASIHNGGHIAFGPDGLLHASTGDAGEPEVAANPASLGGKILRIEPDGSPAGAEAFDGSPVLSYGHRNPQGFDWDGDGRMYASEHGPTGEFGLCCHDEVNLIEPGGFYGWPYLAGDAPAQEGEPPQQPVSPLASSGGGETWAPAGLVVREPDGAATELLVAQLAGERLMRVELERGSPDRVAQIETVIDDLGRLRAAMIGPDRCLYLTTSNTDGRGSPRAGDDRIARVCEGD